MSNVPTRVYLVSDHANGRRHLVKAGNPAQAIRHVVRQQFEAEVASQAALIELLTANGGATVETAGEDHYEPAVLGADTVD